MVVRRECNGCLFVIMIVVDSCKLVFDGMYIFREAFRLLAVLFNQLSKSGNIYRGE